MNKEKTESETWKQKRREQKNNFINLAFLGSFCDFKIY
jgi:hypothetical protein